MYIATILTIYFDHFKHILICACVLYISEQATSVMVAIYTIKNQKSCQRQPNLYCKNLRYVLPFLVSRTLLKCTTMALQS